jgi:hypothetical protein
VQVKRGADVASDHHLVVGSILKLKLRKNWTGEQIHRRKFDTGLLKETPKKEEYTVTLNNKFQVLQELMEEKETIDSKWLKIKEAVTSTCEEVLGNKKIQHKEWISAQDPRKESKEGECQQQPYES